MHDFKIMRRAQLAPSSPASKITSPACLKNCVVMWLGCSIRSHNAHCGSRIDCARGAFIVEADVSARDREIELSASLGHSFDSFAQLEKIFRFMRVSEIEVVGDGQRDSS